jgi:hypothetical protein
MLETFFCRSGCDGVHTINKNAVKKYQDIIAVFCLAGVAAFLCWKAPFGFGFWDESWYITFGHRFVLGDSMVTEEWNIIQLFSIFLYLPVRIYTFIVGSTEGIILSFRYLFVIFQLTSSAAIYLLTRKYGLISILIALIINLFIPANVMAVGYYLLTAVFSILIGLLLSVKSFSKIKLIVIGVLFACIVLCNPFFALIYFSYTVIAIYILSTKHRTKKNHRFTDYKEYISIRTWSWISLGIAVVTFVFIVFLLSGNSIQAIMANLPEVFEDSDYNVFNSGGRTQNIVNLKQTILEVINVNPYLLAAYGALLAVIIIDKKRMQNRRYYLLASLAVVFGFIVYLAGTSDFYKFLLCMFPLTLLGLTSFILCENRNKNIFIFLWLWGIVVAFFQDVSSNQGTKLMSVGLASSCLAGIILTKDLIDEIGYKTEKSVKERKVGKDSVLKKNVAIYALAAVILSQVGFEIYINSDFKTISAEYFYQDLIGAQTGTEELDILVQKRSGQRVDNDEKHSRHL